jgi:hypothetical protein
VHPRLKQIRTSVLGVIAMNRLLSASVDASATAASPFRYPSGNDDPPGIRGSLADGPMTCLPNSCLRARGTF